MTRGAGSGEVKSGVCVRAGGLDQPGRGATPSATITAAGCGVEQALDEAGDDAAPRTRR